MAAPDTGGRGPSAGRLTGIGLLAIGVAVALYVAGRLVQPGYAFSLSGADPIPAKSLLATIALTQRRPPEASFGWYRHLIAARRRSPRASPRE